MCQGIPRRVFEVADGKLRVDMDGEPRLVKAAGHLASVRPGDFVIVYAGVAVETVSPEEAEEQLRFLKDLEELFPADAEAAGSA